MTPRQRVLEAVRRGSPDRCPKEAGFTPAVYQEFRRRTGSDDPATYFGMETRSVGFGLPEQMPDRTAMLRRMPEGAYVADPILGTFAIPAGFYHFWGYLFALGDAETVEEIEAYPFADITRPECHRHLEEQVATWHDRGFFVDGFAGHLFESAWQLIGLDRMLESMVTHPALVEALLERITEQACFRARRLAEAGVDMLRCGDDVGWQVGLMMSPATWRRFLKARLQRVIEAARAVRPGLPIWYHSDGDINAIIDDLIEVGVTVLNPVQPECLDVEDLQRRYHDRLAFWGAIGTQSVMPFGSPQDVRRAVKRMIDLFAPGFVLAPTHVLEPDVPWENIEALFQAVEEFGAYC